MIRRPWIGVTDACRIAIALVLMTCTLVTPALAAPEKGLVAHYTFDEGSGDVVRDGSGCGNNGKNLGAKYVPLGEGKGYALAFETADARVDCGNAPSLDLTRALTIELWLKSLTKIEKGEAGLVGKDNDTFTLAQSGSNFWFYLKGGGNGIATQAVVGSWQHLTATFDGKELRWYVDGKPVKTGKTKFPKIERSSKHFYLRYPVTWGDQVTPTHQCLMDDVRVYNRALSDDEVIAHYKAGAAAKGKDTSAFDRLRLVTHVYPLEDTLLVEADYGLLKPVPAGTKIFLELCDAATGKVLKEDALPAASDRMQYYISPMVDSRTSLSPVDKIEWIVDTSDLAASARDGACEVRAVAKDAKGNQVGEGASARVNVPAAKPAWLEANPSVKRLNNLVTQLLDVARPKPGSSKIVVPRDGWVFIACRGKGDVRVSVDGEAVVTLEGDRTQTGEAMRRLTEGEHTIDLACADGAACDQLVVRQVPTMIFASIGYRPCPWLDCFRPYNWDVFARSGILDNVNVILERSQLGENAQRSRDWKAAGRAMITHMNIQNLWKKIGPVTADNALAALENADGFAKADRDGIIIDEFDSASMPPNQQDYVPFSEAVARLAKDPAYRDKTLYAYGKSMDGQYARGFMKTLLDSGYVFAEETYLQEQPDLKAAEEYLDAALRQRVLRYDELYPGFANQMMVVFAYFSIPKETVDVNPNASFKVFMDMEMHMLANDPVFSDLFGVMWYHVAYANPEILRWSARLFRHYCIEGRRDRLTEDPYELRHITNGDFTRGRAGWTLSPAQKGGITFGSFNGYSWIEGRYPHTPQGDTFLITTRSAKGPNRFSQKIKGLSPGRLYSMEMLTADYADLTGRGKTQTPDQPVSITIDGADVLEDRTIRQPFKNIHPGAGIKRDALPMTYHVVYFRATGSDATLTVSDWAAPDAPGGPEGQQLMYNFIQIQPYLEGWGSHLKI